MKKNKLATLVFITYSIMLLGTSVYICISLQGSETACAGPAIVVGTIVFLVGGVLTKYKKEK